MRAPGFKSKDVLIEIGAESFRLLQADHGMECPLERQENGRLTQACKERLRREIAEVLGRTGRWKHARALCAIEARGVALRRLRLPPAGKEQLQQLIRLQLETEFPLPPAELAWGACELDGSAQPDDSADDGTNWMVAAVRRDVIDDYAVLLQQCGLTPVFTLGALAAGTLCDEPGESFALLELGRTQSELAMFEGGAPIAVRALPYGANSPEDLDACVRQLWREGPLYSTGGELARRGNGTGMEALDYRPLPFPSTPGVSAVTWGLKRWTESNGKLPPLMLETSQMGKESEGKPGWAAGAWAFLALVLLLGVVLLRYAEPLLYQSRLSQRYQEVVASVPAAQEVERELGFLQYVASNQPPCLELLEALANASPGGSTFESLTLSRQGDFTLRGTLEGSKQAIQLRTNMVASGWFTGVVLEEQSPVPNQNNKVKVRLRAHWTSPPKPAAPAPAGRSPTKRP